MDELDNLLADLEKAVVKPTTPTTPSTPTRMSNLESLNLSQSNGILSAGPTVGMTRKYTEYATSTKKSYSSREHVYENNVMTSSSSRTESPSHLTENRPLSSPRSVPSSPQPEKPTSANLSDLDNLLEDLSSARYNAYDNGPSSPRFRDNSEGGSRVNQLIQDLEHNLRNSQDVTRWETHGHEVKPITLTKFYSSTHTSSTSAANRDSEPIQLKSSPQHVVQSTPKSASNATRELDDLMASLSDFKMKNKQPEVHSPKAANAVPLDSMLGNLQSDMSKHGVDTVAKGCCYCCHRPIVGQVVTALGKTWHPEHFTCVHCGTELGTKNFFERDNEPYCEEDYHNLFSPRCAYCSQPILDKCVSALDQTWHPEHFFCAHCGKQFGDDGFHEKDGKAYCRHDYFDLFAPKCGGCNNPITDNYVSALNSQWHPDCFVCRECRCPFVGGSFFDLDGFPYCETHYHMKRGSLCAGCHKPITGRCITAMFRKFHPEHFVCSFCLKQLNKGTFKEQNDKPYCHPCFDKLFG
ncbi:Paxillin [Halotydeus destructor]|nr:Paxillin [Halotydeus destructor]